MHEISTKIVISAAPAKVWSQLMDINSWSQWNPIVNKSQGEASMGATLGLTMYRKDEKDGPS
jgi:hypothetical protein